MLTPTHSVLTHPTNTHTYTHTHSVKQLLCQRMWLEYQFVRLFFSHRYSNGKCMVMVSTSAHIFVCKMVPDSAAATRSPGTHTADSFRSVARMDSICVTKSVKRHSRRWKHDVNHKLDLQTQHVKNKQDNSEEEGGRGTFAWQIIAAWKKSPHCAAIKQSRKWFLGWQRTEKRLAEC